MSASAAHGLSTLGPDAAPVTTIRPLLVWLAMATAAVSFVGLIVVAPLALAYRHNFLALTLYRGFSFACHQIPSRSFYIKGYPLAVCARCAGLYAGFALGVFVYPLVRSLKRTVAPSRVWLIAAMIPLAVDWTLGFCGLWSNTHLSRFTTGVLLGSVSVFYVLPGVMDLAQRGFSAKRFSSKESVSYEQ